MPTPPVSVLGNYYGNLALKALIMRPCWLAAHTDDPTVLGLLASEVGGGGYARAPIAFSVPSGRSATNVAAVAIPGMPAVVVKFLAVWDQVSNGSMIFSILLDTPIVVAASTSLLIAAHDIGISL